MTTESRYILDTNVILYDPEAMYAFPGSEVVIPITAIEEIDQFKKEMSETGRNARIFSNSIDRYRLKGHLSQGIRLENGSLVRVHVWNREAMPFPRELDMRKASNRVLATAFELHRQDDGSVHTVLVSQDTNLRIRANALGIDAVSYEGDYGDISEIYTGFTEMEVLGKQLEDYRANEWLELEGSFYPNHCIVVRDRQNDDNYEVYRYRAEERAFHAIRDFSAGVWEIRPRNPQQAIALEFLMDPSVSVITLMGKAGTGKTLLALAAGLQMMMEESAYTKLLVSRPIFPMGRDVGYLPGNIEEKLDPWMQPIFDNLEYLINAPVSRHSQMKGYHALIDQGLINIEPLTYIRGRSIPKQFMVVDEAQNLTPHEIKTIITRVGEGTKIVLTGDPYQIDNPYVDSVSNGLSHVVERFKEQGLAGHVILLRGERSPLAEMAANIL